MNLVGCSSAFFRSNDKAKSKNKQYLLMIIFVNLITGKILKEKIKLI